MGCTWISLITLAVSVIASFMANTETTTYTTSTVTNKQESTMRETKHPTVLPTTELSTDAIITTEKIPITTNRQQIINTDKTNGSETSNCTYLENAETNISSSGSLNNCSSFDEHMVEIKTYRDFPEYTRYRNLGRVSPFITNIPGFITNTLTIVIAISIKPLHTSEIYMITLGLADLLTVIARFTLRMVERYVDTISATACKILWYTPPMAQVYSNMILVAWTIERFIAVMFPIKLASWCSVKNTKVTVTLLLLICLLLSIPNITESDAFSVWNGRTIVNVCYFSEFMYAVWTHVESVYYIYLPMITVCICNGAILLRLSAMTKARISMASNQETIDKKTKESRKMTILLLTISATFLLLHIPYAIVLIFGYIYPDVTVLLQKDPHAFAKYVLYTACGYFITECQNSSNFFLYCISGTKFRSAFRKMICKHATVKQPTASHSATTQNTSY